MKTVIRIFTICVVTIFLISSTAIAMPANSVILGEKGYSIESLFGGVSAGDIQAALDAANGKLYYNLTGQTNGFVGLFSGTPMTQAQMDELTGIEYVNPDGSTSTYANFCDNDPIGTVSVKGTPTVINRTHISVTFAVEGSADVTREFEVAELQDGANTRTVAFDSTRSFNVTVNYNVPDVVVEDVLRDNYRHFQVVFSGLVDHDSAEKAENYYFFINEGTADYKAILPASNQLDTIGAKFEAKDVQGKTVVDVYLPEDARFTNIADFLPQLPSEPSAEFLQQIPLYNFWFEFYGFDSQAWIDDEQSIIVNRSNDVHGANSNFWTLTKGREVDVGVRNVRDLSKERTIDTASITMEIVDDVRPDFISAAQVDEEGQFDRLKAVPTIPVYTDGSEIISMLFSEPVFNTHGLGVGDINNQGHYNVEVAVDDQKVASTNDLNLNGVLNFYMDADDTYAAACTVDLNIAEAIDRLYDDGFRADNVYNIKITGITDLAGNLMDPQVVEFNVSLRDKEGGDGACVQAPEIIKVEQVHDNVFRVFANRSDVSGKFEIRNGDGEDGIVETYFNGTPNVSGNLFYTEIVVSAVDTENNDGASVRNDQLLAYDAQNTLFRIIRVSEVTAPNITTSDENDVMTGDSKEYSFTLGNPFEINKDIYAPVIETNPGMIKWWEDNYSVDSDTIVLDVEDVMPDTWGASDQPAYAMLYDYKLNLFNFNNLPYGLFDYNSIDVRATEFYNMSGIDIVDWQWCFDLLPVTVSFTVNGVERTAVVSNRCILEEFANDPAESPRHYGAPGSIRYDFANQHLIIDLCAYPDLLDGNGNLVQGVDYKINIPAGYFADQGQFDAYDINPNGGIETSQAVYFVPGDAGTDPNVQYVSDGRSNNAVDPTKHYPIEPRMTGDGDKSYMVQGYTSNETLVTQPVGVMPVVPPEPNDAVPQTSQELINWNEDRNEIWVEFTGTIDIDTLKDPANYVLNDKTLKEMGLTSADIAYVESSENTWVDGDLRKFARIALPYDTIAVDGDYLFKVSGVSNEAGGTMTPVEVRLDIDENVRPVIEGARIIGNNQIELTFSEPVRYVADPAYNPANIAVACKDNFVVLLGGVGFVPEAAIVGTTPLDINYDEPTYPLNTVVTLNLGSVDLINSSMSVKVQIVDNQNGRILLEDDNCNPLNDEVAPFTVRQ